MGKVVSVLLLSPADLVQIATQPSIWDSENVEEYKDRYIHPKWENMDAFDPNFRWTWREENAARRKVDWKIMASLTGVPLTPIETINCLHRSGLVSCSQR